MRHCTSVLWFRFVFINQNVLVFQRTGGDVSFVEGRDLWWHEQLGQQRAVCPVEWMDAEDELFMLYTSGSTGKPKGVVFVSSNTATQLRDTCWVSL